MTLGVFEERESAVRGYVRSFPTVFTTAKGATITDEDGTEYLDFFAGAGALNYGHNPDVIKEALAAYIESDGIVHGLDMATAAKRRFMSAFHEIILEPRGMDHKMQFTGPTGTNAVEAALKLARKVTGREQIVAFTHGFHGVTLGALAATGNAHHRGGAGVPLTGVTRVPFDGYLGDDVDTLDEFERMLDDSSSGIETPAAVIVETVQGEGGVNVASGTWLRRLETLCRERGILFIIDDIQVGCGRTGRFFSFEEAGIEPDIVTLSKSLSAYGLPFAMLLVKPEHDVWKPGEHNGTFRGFNPAFVTAAAALEAFWRSDDLADEVARKGESARQRLEDILSERDALEGSVRGRGLVLGIELSDAKTTAAWAKRCFERGLIIETAGADDEVMKLLPPLTITDDELERGLDILEEALDAVLAAEAATPEVAA